jgi:hypothetical protein
MPQTQEIYPEDLRYLGASGNDRDNDGVPDNRDVEPRTSKIQKLIFGEEGFQEMRIIFLRLYISISTDGIWIVSLINPLIWLRKN